MQTRLVASCVGLLSFLAAACSAVSSEEGTSVDADELTAMAAPGVDESALDRAADPCADFYEFACGGYVASLPADTRRQIRSFAQLSQSNTAVLAQVFDAIVSAPRSEAERNASALYKSCMATTNQARATEFVTAFRAEIDAATTPDALARVVARLHRRGADALFGFMATADSTGRGRHGTAVVNSGGYDWRTDYTKPEARAARVTKLVSAVTVAEPTLTTDVATRIATSAVAIEQALASAASHAGQGGDQASHPVGQVGLEAAAPHVDWKSYFTTLGRTNLGSFGVDNLDYFAALDTLLGSASLDDIHAYLTAHWYEAEQPTPATAQACQRQIESLMSDAIEPRFLELAGVDAKAQAKARTLFRAIVDAFGEELKAEPFLDVSTRVEAQVKLAKMRGAIGASRELDTFVDVDLAESDPFVENAARLAERSFDQQLAQIGKALPLLHVDFPAPIVNASYDGSLNKINVPGGILGGFFFSASSPKLANFAAIGSVLGHELTHGFDNNGRRLDGDGVERDWWTPTVETAFNDRAQCLIDEYSAFTLPGVTDPATGQSPAHINGKRTLGENIADNGGVKTAFRASKVEGMTGPVIAGFTPAQQFFVSYGQLWCGKTAPDVAAQSLTRDSHSPEKARVNVPLANFDAFAAAFQCQPGTPMAPVNRCGVW